MPSIHDLETPAVLIDLDRLEANVVRMAARAREAGVALRPHAKTHKVPEIGWMQMRAGAVGLSLAKTSEAEVFARHGFPDLFVAYPVVSPSKADRLMALSRRVRLCVGVDSIEGAEVLAAAAVRSGQTLRVSLKVDSGFHRVGVDPKDAVSVGSRVAALKGLSLTSVFTHAGQAYHRADPKDIERDNEDEAKIVVAAALGLRQAGVPIETVSVGSTPTSRFGFAHKGVTEARPGNYVYLDRTQAGLGTCSFDECAMSILATVVSVSGSDRAVLDSGSKTLALDMLRPKPDGYGLIVGSTSRLSALSEEHGIVAVDPGDVFKVGERVRVLPNHACVVSNLHDRVYGVRGDRIETVFEVAARGCVD
ncbi:MAG: alanine racemase [Vicinamibacteria bacterium]|nr:alanine racemase [Vicinamibacteria bacterium]